MLAVTCSTLHRGEATRKKGTGGKRNIKRQRKVSSKPSALSELILTEREPYGTQMLINAASSLLHDFTVITLNT